MIQTKPLKILQVISTPPFAWDTGGCAKVVYDSSIELSKRGHDITILTTDLFKPHQRHPINNPEVVNGVKIIRFKYINDKLAWKYKIYISPGMIKYLKNNLQNYDLVHLQDYISLQAIFTSYFCKKYSIPYVITTHGSTYWILQKNLINQLYFKLAGKRILVNSSKIIALTEMELEHFKKIRIDRNKVIIIPNGVNLDCYQTNIPSKGEFKRKYGLESDKIILYLGRLNKIKGIDSLIKVFYKLTKELKNIKLVIVGPDEGFKSELEDLCEKYGIKELVLFTGPLYDFEKAEAFVDADVYVLPSRYETFPITVLESWSYGAPVIVTNNCGISNYVEKAGMVVNNDLELKNDIFKILTDNELSEKLMKIGKEVVIQFDWSNISKKIENLYYGVLINENNDFIRK